MSKGNHTCYCPTNGIIDLIARKWTLCVINALKNHEKLRFNEIITELKYISPKTLTKTLKDLEEQNIIRRDYFKDIPPRVEYSLSENGKELQEVIYPLLKWIDMHTNIDSLTCCSCSCSECQKMYE